MKWYRPCGLLWLVIEVSWRSQLPNWVRCKLQFSLASICLGAGREREKSVLSLFIIPFSLLLGVLLIDWNIKDEVWTLTHCVFVVFVHKLSVIWMKFHFNSDEKLLLFFVLNSLLIFVCTSAHGSSVNCYTKKTLLS